MKVAWSPLCAPWLSSSRRVQLPIRLYVILKLLILPQQHFDLLLEPLLCIHRIILLILQIRLLLLPLSPLLLESEKLLRLLRLC